MRLATRSATVLSAAGTGPSEPQRLDHAGGREASVNRPADPQAQGCRPRILLAEDDREMRAMLVQLLSYDGYEVLEARDGAELSDLIAAHTARSAASPLADLIISDLHMPFITGLDAYVGLRALDPRTPFILITAFPEEDVVRRCLADGVTAVFAKPFDLDVLRAKVAMLLGRDRTNASDGR